VSGEIHERLAGTATLTSGRILDLNGARGLAAMTERRPTLALGDKLSARSGVGFGALRMFDVVAIERAYADDSAPPTGAAVVYLREVAR
jgi:hypothetical protein